MRLEVMKIRGVQRPVDSDGRDKDRNTGRYDQRKRERAERLAGSPIVPGKRKHEDDSGNLPGDRRVAKPGTETNRG